MGKHVICRYVAYTYIFLLVFIMFLSDMLMNGNSMSIGVKLFLFWPIAFYFIYTLIKSYPYCVFPNSGCVNPFGIKKSFGRMAKVTVFCVSLFTIIILASPFLYMYSNFSMERVIELELDYTSEELERTRQEIQKLERKLQAESLQ